MSVLVTGASRGIGAAIARQLAPGHDIAVAYNNSKAAADEVATAVRDAGADAITVQADVTNSEAVENLAETVVDGLGGLDAVAPGPVETDMNGDILDYLEAIDFRGYENVDTHLPEYACAPETVAQTVAYLLENDYVQAEIVNVKTGCSSSSSSTLFGEQFYTPGTRCASYEKTTQTHLQSCQARSNRRGHRSRSRRNCQP